VLGLVFIVAVGGVSLLPPSEPRRHRH
jgi:hypothetical protein